MLWTKAVLVMLQLAASGTDAYYTNRNMQLKGATEHTTYARPFVTRGTAGVVTFFALDAGIKLEVAHLLRRKTKPLVGNGFAVVGITDNTIGAAYSASHYHYKEH